MTEPQSKENSADSDRHRPRQLDGRGHEPPSGGSQRVRRRPKSFVALTVATAGVLVLVAGIVAAMSSGSASSSLPDRSEGLVPGGERIVEAKIGTIESVLVIDAVAAASEGETSMPDGSTPPPLELGQSAGRPFDLVSTVDPNLLYRFYSPPTKIMARIDQGPGPFECTFLSIGNQPGGSAQDPVQLRCRVPDGIRVFSGVRAKVAVTTGVASNVVVLPVSAVDGDADNGSVTLARADGEHEQRSVRLGLTDGVRVEVVDGLTAGEKVLDIPDGLLSGLGITSGSSDEPAPSGEGGTSGDPPQR